ncbi:hypothetical protein [Flavobacterium sp. AG291]|uniref:hypothetical protein n=1 Tax=Flavobacterium sp. AG291 TaxID=2184000 RepID=UPI000E0A89DD|nr:hypothetical protein [Flavobacterium sp. AG291]RDI11197.1 hypothetical protein DEU42_106131 [Flavobacterium sp. AG291]
MKTITTTLLVLLMIVSCNSNDSNVKYSYSYNSDGVIKREMTVKNNKNDIDIEMKGNATFNDDETAITQLTPGGSINYRNKDTKLTAASSKEGIKISIEKNNSKISATSDTGKEIIKEAITHIKKLQQKHK